MPQNSVTGHLLSLGSRKRHCVHEDGSTLPSLKINSKDMNIIPSVIVLLAACTGSSQAEEAATSNSNVRYEGPVVYSNLPPPVLYFPSVHQQDHRLRSNNFPPTVHQSGITKNAIEYVPFPYQDLPVLVYQSKENPPIHVVNNLQEGDKSSEVYKNINTKGLQESPSAINSLISSNGHKGIEGNYYQQALGAADVSLNNGLEYQHVLIQLPQQVPRSAYIPGKEDEPKHYNTLPYYQNDFPQPQQSNQYYRTPYDEELDTKSGYEKLSRQTYEMEQSHDHGQQPSEAYQTVALIDYSHLMSSNPERDPSDETTGKNRDFSPERTGYFWRQSSHPTLRQYLHAASSISGRPQFAMPAPSDARYYHSVAPINPFAAFYDVSTRYVNLGHGNQYEQKPDSAYSVSASNIHPLYVPTSAQHSAQESMTKNYRTNTESSNIVYQASPSSIQQLYVQMPEESDKGSRDTKHIDNAASSPQTGLKYESTNVGASALPHVVYTGHPPIHVFQHPIVIKVSTKEGEKHQSNTHNSYSIKNSATENQLKIPVGSIGNFGVLKPTFQKGSLDSTNLLEQTSSNADAGIQSLVYPEGAKNSGNLADIFRQQTEAYLAGQGQVQAISLPVGFDSIAIYGGKFGPFGAANRGYYNRFLIRNRNPSTGQSPNAAVLASRLFGRLAALGNTLFVNNLGLKPHYYHNLVSPQSYGTVTELLNTQPVPKLESLHHTSPSSNRDSGLNSKLSDRMSATHVSHSGDSGRPAESNLKVQYKTPPTKATAAPQHHKPPIIIYKGIQPPVHVYGDEDSIEKGSNEGFKTRSNDNVHSIANGQLNPKDYVEQGSFSITTAHGISTAHSNQPSYHPESYAVPGPQTYSVPYDYSASTFSNRASVDHEEFDNAEQTYHPALDYPRERSDASWMPINFPQYTEAESISDSVVTGQQLENPEKSSVVEKQLQLNHQDETSDTLQPRADEAVNTDEGNTEMKN